MKQLIHLDVLASFPLVNFGADLVQVNYGFQVLARESALFVSHFVTSCGEETLRQG